MDQSDNDNEKDDSPRLEYVILKADDRSWTVKKSTLLGFDRPSSKIDPEKNFFASLLSGQFPQPRVVTGNGETTFGKDASDSSDRWSRHHRSLPTFLLNFDPKCIDLIIRYLRGYFVDFKTLSLELRENLLRDANLMGIPGIQREIKEQCKSSQMSDRIGDSDNSVMVVKELKDYTDLRIVETPDVKTVFFGSRVCETCLKTGPLRVYTACQGFTTTTKSFAEINDNNDRESFDKWYDRCLQGETPDKNFEVKLFIRGVDNSDSAEFDNLLNTIKQAEAEALALVVSLVREKWNRKEWIDLDLHVLKQLLSACMVRRHRQDPKHPTKEDLVIPLKPADLKKLQFIDVADKQVSSREALWSAVCEKPLFRLYMRPWYIWYRHGSQKWCVHWEVPIISLATDFTTSTPKKKIRLS